MTVTGKKPVGCVCEVSGRRLSLSITIAQYVFHAIKHPSLASIYRRQCAKVRQPIILRFTS